MARKWFYIDKNGNCIAEFPRDILKGWESGKRGVRRKIAHLKDFEGRADKEVERELENLWILKEREFRQQQVEKDRQAEELKSRKKRLSIKEVLLLWLNSLEITNKRQTKIDYKRSVELFINAIGDFQLMAYDTSYGIKFRAYMQQYRKANGRPISLSSQQKHVRHLNVFFNWAFEHEYIKKPIKLKSIKVPRKDMKTLDVTDLDKVIKAVALKAVNAEKAAIRARYKGLERAMVLARHTILRSGAIWALKLANIDLDARIIKIEAVPEIGWTPKALKYPIKPINDDLYKYLSLDLESRSPDEIWYLDDGCGEQWRKVLGNLTRDAARAFEELGYPKMKPFHEAFRSTLITHMLVQGVAVPTVQQLADHSSIQTTYGYLDTRRVQQEQAVAALSSLPSKPTK